MSVVLRPHRHAGSRCLSAADASRRLEAVIGTEGALFITRPGWCAAASVEAGDRGVGSGDNAPQLLLRPCRGASRVVRRGALVHSVQRRRALLAW